MHTTTHNISRTAHLLALLKKGDDAFNSRDYGAMDVAHHPEVIVHMPGSAEPTYGRAAHTAMIEAMLHIFPDVHVDNDPYPIQFGSATGSPFVTRVTGTFTGEMVLPDGSVIVPTGRAFDIDFGRIARWDGDLLIEEFVFWDSALQAQQVGVG
jgi:hypothetical protein